MQESKMIDSSFWGYQIREKIQESHDVQAFWEMSLSDIHPLNKHLLVKGKEIIIHPNTPNLLRPSFYVVFPYKQPKTTFHHGNLRVPLPQCHPQEIRLSAIFWSWFEENSFFSTCLQNGLSVVGCNPKCDEEKLWLSLFARLECFGEILSVPHIYNGSIGESFKCLHFKKVFDRLFAQLFAYNLWARRVALPWRAELSCRLSSVRHLPPVVAALLWRVLIRKKFQPTA